MATSRLCVKGLPKHASDDHLRKLFAEKGQVTDAKVVRTRYVGGHTSCEAASLPGSRAKADHENPAEMVHLGSSALWVTSRLTRQRLPKSTSTRHSWAQ